MSAQLFDHFIFPAAIYDIIESLPKFDYVSAFVLAIQVIVARSYHVLNLHFGTRIFSIVIKDVREYKEGLSVKELLLSKL